MILAIDSSGGELVVCLVGEDLAVVSGRCLPGRRHQEAILDIVEDVLGGREHVARLDAIAVVRGPGSQTGLRVGLAAAEGLSFASRRPLQPLSSLAVAAHRVPVAGDLIAGVSLVAAVSAGRSNVYAQLFQGRGTARIAMGERVLAAVPDIHGRLKIEHQVPLGAEAAVHALFGERLPGSLVGAVDRLAGATREALSASAAVSYHGLTGDYGE